MRFLDADDAGFADRGTDEKGCCRELLKGAAAFLPRVPQPS